MSAEKFLGSTTSKGGTHLVEHLFASGNLSLFWQIPGCSEGSASRHDGDLDERIGVLQEPAYCGVTGFVEGDGALLLGSHHFGLLLQSSDNAVHSSQEVVLVDSFLPVSSCDESRFVADIGDVGTAETGCLTGQEVDVERAVGLDGFQVHLEDFLALVHIGQLDMYLAVKASCTQQGLVQDVGTVGGSHNDDTAIGSEAVHLGEELVESALAFVVASHLHVAASSPSHSINLVDEDDAGSFLFRLTEKVANTTGSDAHKHLDEIAARHAEERHIGFTCNGFRQQSLTRSGRAYEQSALGNLATQFRVALGVLEELHDFLHLELCTFLTGHIGKGHLVAVVLLEEFGAALANIEDTHRTASAFASATHSSHQENPEEEDEDERTETPEEVHEVVFSLTVLNLALEVLEGLLLADEVLQLVGRGDLHHDIRSRALVDLLLLEDIAYVVRFDIHLQGAFLLVDNDSGSVALLHIALELAISGVSRRAA